MSVDSAKENAVVRGLKGVQAADSSICLVNGSEGRLLFRGLNVDGLAEEGSYEETAFLLLHGKLPSRDELSAFHRSLLAHRKLPEPVLAFLRSVPAETLPMAAVRSAISIAGVHDPEAEQETVEANVQKSIRLIALFPTIVAAVHRLRNGLEPVAPNPELGHAANFMAMLNGRPPTAQETKAMQLIFILHAEHGFNASTFTARVIASTLSDLYSAVTGAIGALKGKLHGGANAEVLKNLMEIGSVDRVTDWVEQVRAQKGKFMGFGHAVYQTVDPRAKHLKELSRRLAEEKGEPKWYEISAELEKQVTAAIGKHCNVDFYSASLQHYLGVPRELFTCIFAASRTAGWCAHILEQQADNKIIRPKAHYVGPAEWQYVPIDQR